VIYTIENDLIRVQASSRGAELQSIVLKQDGTEYLWQGDPTYWNGRAYNLFPICGRLWEGKYTYDGKTYEMNLHGFARKSELELAHQEKDKLVFRLRADEKTLAMYPFRFELTISYALVGTSVMTTLKVVNRDEKLMIFAVGGHPGFNVPMNGRDAFTDHYLEFDAPGHVQAIAMSETCYTTEHHVMLPLRDGKILPLRHEMFDNDALLLADMGKAVTLKSRTSDKQVRLEFPNMNYLGVWHAPKTEAPYVCIEPWTSVPAYQGRIDALETKRDMLTLPQGEQYENTYVITVK